MSVNSAVFLHLLTQSPDLPQDNSKWPPAEQTERFSFTCSVCMPLTHPHTTHPWHTHTHPTEIDPFTTTYTRIHTYIYMYNYTVHTYRHPLRMWEDTTQCKYIQKLIIHNYRWGTQISKIRPHLLTHQISWCKCSLWVTQVASSGEGLCQKPPSHMRLPPLEQDQSWLFSTAC